MKRFTIWALFAIVALIISLSTAGCTSNVANQASNTGNQTSSASLNMATYESGNFTIQYPSDWKKATDRTTFSDGFTVLSGGTSVTAVSINMSVSLSSYSNSRIETLKSNTNYTLIESGNTTLAGNPAYKAIYTLNYEGISGKFMEIWTIKEGKIYSITYTATPGNYDTNVETAQKRIDSFQIK
ncbi:MAG: PsbP-related protein [Halobacteriota archaeon]